MNIQNHRLVDVFKREYETTRSLEAAVGAVATAVLASVEADEVRTTANRGERMAQVAPLMIAGERATAIAAKLGITRKAVEKAVERAAKNGLLPLRRRIVFADPPPATIAAVLEVVAGLHGKSPDRLFDRQWGSRQQCTARWIAAATLRRMGMSMPKIAAAVGLADHSTVHRGLRLVDASAELTAQAEWVWRQVAPEASALDPKTAQAGGVAA